MCIYCVLYNDYNYNYHLCQVICLFFIHKMITKLAIRNNSIFIYLTKAMIQLLHIVPENTFFIFTLKNKCLCITEADETSKNMPFATKVRKTGSGWGIYLSKSMVEILDINPETDFIDIDIEDNVLIVKKAL